MARGPAERFARRIVTQPCYTRRMAKRDLLVVLAGLALSCGPVAREARPGDPTAAGAMGERCAKGGDPQPLVVDLNATERADLEVAMRRGVAVVSYDCKHLHIVPDCTLEGGYDYIGVTPKDQELELADSDEIKANLPAGVIAASVSGEMQRGASLHVKLSIVGKKMSTITEGARQGLRGRCETATHFVRAVTTGAFQIETETRAAAQGQAAALGATASSKGASERKAHQADGDRAACATASASATAPPEKCAAPLRLDLIALGTAPAAGAVAAQPASPSGGCPGGLVWSAGACRTPRVNAPHKCLSNDVDECRKQCELGDASSCTEIGFEHLTGRRVPLDRARAAEFFRKACDGGDHYGCNNLGALLIRGSAADARRALALLEGVCGSEPSLCSNLAVAYRDGLGMPAQPARATELFSRGCLGGDAGSCHDLALAYDNGVGVLRDVPRAAELQAESCRRGFMQACAVMGTRYLYGTGVKVDEALAVRYWKAACDGKSQLGCGLYGFAVMTGVGGVRRDERGGRDMMEQACNSGSADSCAILAATLQSQGDPAGAKQWYRRACEGGLKDHCGK
jgi:TPR repeat protein